jgi:alkylhydroperoxidase family enzyme
VARVSYIEEANHPELSDVIGKLKAGRDGRLINIYKLLLHNPRIAETWFEHIGAVRWQTQLDGQTREIAIIRIGLLNKLDYVFQQHVPRHTAPEGLTDAQCKALKDWQASDAFDAKQRAVLALTDAMTCDVQVPDDVFDALRPHFSQTQIVELAVLVGTYNMHTRVLSALQIDPEV